MTLTRPIASAEQGRSTIRRKSGAPYQAAFGADNGEFDVRDNPGYIWVREILSNNPATGEQTYGEAHEVRQRGTFPYLYGLPLDITYNAKEGEWEAREASFTGMRDMGIHPGIVNPLNPYLQSVDMSSVGPLRSYATSRTGKTTTEVGIKNYFYLDYLGDLRAFQLDLTNRPDIADNAPGVGLKRLVHLWLTLEGDIEVSVSTPINTALPFDFDIDGREVLENAPDQLAQPIGAWKIQNGQTAITGEDLYIDTRSWLNPGQTAGFPNPITKNYRIPDGITVTHAGGLVVTGSLIVQGSLFVL